MRILYSFGIRFLTVALSAAAAVAAVSCTAAGLLQQDRELHITVRLPDAAAYAAGTDYAGYVVQPDAATISEIAGWDVVCTQPSGSRRISVAPNAGSCTVSVTQDVPAGILAYPVIADGTSHFPVYPAGCIYPYGRSCTIPDGFAADILSSLYAGASSSSDSEYFAQIFNWPRFMDAVRRNKTEAEAAGTQYNPWLLDKSAVLTAIANRTFSVRKLTLTERPDESTD